MKQVLIATTNKGKVIDFETLLNPLGIKVKSLLDFSNPVEVEETGVTFLENAILKAEAISNHFNAIVIADDSGLAIDALNGRPGVYSARYAGEQKNDQANIEKVLDELRGIQAEKRTARFHCVLALAIPGKKTITVDGTCDGVISESPIGEHGFGYDPIFFVPKLNKTMAQLTRDEKNKISHRAKALNLLVEQLHYLELDKDTSV